MGWVMQPVVFIVWLAYYMRVIGSRGNESSMCSSVEKGGSGEDAEQCL